MLALAKRRPGLVPEDFQERWRHELGPLVQAVPDIYRAGRKPAFDGMASLWFDDNALAAEQMQPVVACKGAFLEPRAPSPWSFRKW